MLCWRNPFLIKTTLLFFVSMLLYHPAMAEQFASIPATATYLAKHHSIPITTVNAEQAQQLIQTYQRMGYEVQQGTYKQLRQLILASNSDSPKRQNEEKSNNHTEASTKKDSDCKKPIESTKSVKNEPHAQKKTKQHPDSGCTPEKDKTSVKTSQQGNQTNSKPMAVQMPNPSSPPESQPAPAQEPPPPPVTVQPAINVNVDILKGGGGGGGHSGDSAKVFFIISGILVVAAFVVYAGKYIVDIAQGNTKDLWWDITFNSTYLDTRADQHGRFNGVKLATGIVSKDLFQMALTGEVGNTNLYLKFNENTTPITLDISGMYWMLGATMRLFLSSRIINTSYLFLDFMGGKTNQTGADTIGAARLGANFGIGDHMRLGANIGAQYIGLSNDQGFVNNNDKYWYTYGVEMGVRF